MNTATAGVGAATPKTLPFLEQLRANPRLPLIIGVSFAVAAIAALWLWSRQPDYGVLYSNLSDRDGGAIIASLQQMNIPYKFAEGGGALLVQASKVPEARLRLASQGLPKGGTAGFELMDNQKFGTSQFAEQINYQRARRRTGTLDQFHFCGGVGTGASGAAQAFALCTRAEKAQRLGRAVAEPRTKH